MRGRSLVFTGGMLASCGYVPNPNLVDESGETGESAISCNEPEAVPEGALLAEYHWDLNDVVYGGSGAYTNWALTEPLPAGLSIDASTGVISGHPEEIGEWSFTLSLSVDDAQSGDTALLECGEVIVKVNSQLSANDVRANAGHCIPHDTAPEDLLDYLSGGDKSEVTCKELVVSDLPCPLGDGNGRLPPGISFDASTCTHSGNITGSTRGTWVWLVEIEQSGFSTRLPFCATNDVDTYHDIVLTANSMPSSDLAPGLLEYDPSMALAFGHGSHQWQIIDPACNTDPSLCYAFGFRFDVTCSPFDPPFALNAVSSGVGIDHALDAGGPVPSSPFATRPFVASFEMAYCTSNAGADCDVVAPDFETYAQTKYHYDVIGYPVLGNP